MSFADLQRGGGAGGRQPGAQRPPSSPLGRSGDVSGEFEIVLRQATQNIHTIGARVKAIRDVVAGYGTQRDTPTERSKVGIWQNEVRQLADNTRDMVRRMEALPTTNGSEQNRRKMQVSKLTKDLDEVMRSFNDLEAAAATKERSTAPPPRKPSTLSPGQLASEEANERQPLLAPAPAPQRQIQTQLALDNEVEYNEAIIAEREEGIERIHTEILQVNEIFRDLGTMVSEQGAQLDHIEANLSSTNNTTAKGLQDLTEAQKHQRKARGKLCCILFVALVVAMILGLIVFMETYHPKS
eukprot:comp19764_c2_seq1/m.23646 comp19764_c2_seq1/g.23646  ORF comp19764_c2_seq1/g.23646 comp19764_c2_seq1/m.23646 type:complete len:297 (-) comp19764_c2_seq1:67-957(-)